MANTENEVQVSATAKYVRMAPRKVRMVVDQIRGKKVDRALEILQFSTRAAAEPVAKTLQSAVANAENNNGLRADNLYVKYAYVDEGPTHQQAHEPHHRHRRTSEGGVGNGPQS